MKLIKSQKDLYEIQSCDIELESINWINNGKNIELIFQINNNTKCKFTCKWANNLKIELKTQPNEGGYPLTWDITIKEDKVLNINFDFSSKGQIDLCCNELNYNVF